MSLKVVIDHPKKHYLPGAFIVGRVQCSIRVPDYIEVCVKMVGEESTHTAETTKAIHGSSSRGLKGYFLETKNTVIRSEYLTDGEYEFRFNLTLPRGIPSSFVGKYGYVRYYLKARMYRQGRERYEDVKEFKVFSPVDLNEIENVSMSPSTYSEEPVEETTWLCSSQRPRMEVKLERNAFIVGDIVNVVVVMKKRLNISVVKVHLLMKIKAKVASQKREYLSVTEWVAADQEHHVGNRRKKFYMFALKIPDAVRIPNFEKCFFFSQTAVLEVIAVFRDPSKPDMKVEAEVILGHIPVEEQKKTRSIRGKSRQEDISMIRPLPYSINSRLPTNTLQSESSDLPTSMPKPCPPYPTEVDFPFICQDVVPTKMPKLPELLSNNTCHPSQQQSLPYPKEDSLSHLEDTSNTLPYPCDNNLPYSVKNNCPYPTEKSNANQSHPDSTPYMTDKSIDAVCKRNQEYNSPIIVPPYPVEDTEHRVLPKNIPYPSEKKEDCNLPYPVESNSINSTESKVPVVSLPYPKEDIHTPYPPKINTLPYPDEHPVIEYEKSAPYPTTSDLPYPKVEPRSFRLSSTVFENEQLPYAPSQEELVVPTSISAVSRTGKSTTMNTNVPSSTVGYTAPYPIEVPTRHSSIGFSTHLAMPMPMVDSHPVQNSIGFQVPSSDQNFSRTQFQPSAPPVSELLTPPIATIDELDDSDLENIGSTSRFFSRDVELEDAVVSVGERYRSPPPTYEETVSSIKEKRKKPRRKILVAS